MPPWLLHLLGLDTAGGTPYLFYSGVLGNASIFGGALLWARHKNCTTPGCWRLGHMRHAGGQSVLLCHVHHEQSQAGLLPAPDPPAELIIRIDALGEAITASTRAAERQTDVLADLAETVRASLNREG